MLFVKKYTIKLEFSVKISNYLVLLNFHELFVQHFSPNFRGMAIRGNMIKIIKDSQNSSSEAVVSILLKKYQIHYNKRYFADSQVSCYCSFNYKLLKFGLLDSSTKTTNSAMFALGLFKN